MLCATKTGGVDKAAKFADLVADNYHHNWILDNLPAAAVSEAVEDLDAMEARLRKEAGLS